MPVRVVVRAAAGAVEEYGERMRSELPAQALAERDDGARRGRARWDPIASASGEFIAA